MLGPALPRGTESQGGISLGAVPCAGYLPFPCQLTGVHWNHLLNQLLKSLLLKRPQLK